MKNEEEACFEFEHTKQSMIKPSSDIFTKACQALEDSVIYYKEHPVGTVAARDPDVDALNYNHCFIRDFVSSALIYLINGKPEIGGLHQIAGRDPFDLVGHGAHVLPQADMLDHGIGEDDVVLAVLDVGEIACVALNHAHRSFVLAVLQVVRVEVHAGDRRLVPVDVIAPYVPKIIGAPDVEDRAGVLLAQHGGDQSLQQFDTAPSEFVAGGVVSDIKHLAGTPACACARGGRGRQNSTSISA